VEQHRQRVSLVGAILLLKRRIGETARRTSINKTSEAETLQEARPHDVALPQHRYDGGAKVHRGETREDGSMSENRSLTGREIDRCQASLLGQSQQDLGRYLVENGLQLAGIGGELSFAGNLIRIVQRPCRIVGNVL
jgi:hypothetical protein